MTTGKTGVAVPSDKTATGDFKLGVVGSGHKSVTHVERDWETQDIKSTTAHHSGETFTVAVPGEVIAAMRDALVADLRKSMPGLPSHPAVQPTPQSLDDAIRDKVGRANELLKAMGGVTLQFTLEEDELLPPDVHARSRVDLVAVNQYAHEQAAQFGLHLGKATKRLIEEGVRMGYEVALETHFGERLKLAAASATAAAVLQELSAAEQHVEHQRAAVRKAMGPAVEKINIVRGRDGRAPLKHLY